MSTSTVFLLILAVAGTVFGVAVACFDRYGCPRLWLAEVIGTDLLTDFVKGKNREAQENQPSEKSENSY